MIGRLALPANRIRAVAVVLCLAVAALLQVLDANPAVSQSTSLTAMRTDRAPSLDPGDSVWKRAPAVEVPLSAQSVTYPFGGGSVAMVRAQAMHDDDTLFVRVSWDDSTADIRTSRVEDFADAVAVQFPAVASSSAPAICMGQADNGVNIWQWRADRQGELPGAVEDLNANGYVDLYPSTDDLFFTAREAGNVVAQDGKTPVEDLVAGGFGTLSPAADQSVLGQGHWGSGKWAVVFSRPFVSDDDGRPTFDVGSVTDVAVAAWDGDHDDRNGQKAVSQFLRLSITGEELPAMPRSNLSRVGAAVAIVAVLLLLVAGFAYFTDADWRKKGKKA